VKFLLWEPFSRACLSSEERCYKEGGGDEEKDRGGGEEIIPWRNRRSPKIATLAAELKARGISG